MKIIKALSLTLFVHSFAGWVYIAHNAVYHPETLSRGLTHFAPWPREDTFGIVCFAVSIVSFFVWSMVKDEK
ncbi:hypothetical protein KKE45_01635 [Patescibacteria group bacterium]|nr:hypothetical protein [Patescibacteria group bacterium]